MTGPADTTPEALTAWMTTVVDGRTYPFREADNGDLTGYGRIEHPEFAELASDYETATGAGRGPWTTDSLGHAWVVLDPDGETMHAADEWGIPHHEGTPGAFPVTTLWDQRAPEPTPEPDPPAQP